MVGFIVMTFFLGGLNLYLGITKKNLFNMWTSGFCYSACITAIVFTL